MAYQVKLTHEQRAVRRREIAAYASKHGTLAAVMHFSVSKETVHKSLWEAGLKAPLPPRRRGARSIEILKAILVDKLSNRDAANKLGVSRQRVGQVRTDARKAGFPI